MIHPAYTMDLPTRISNYAATVKAIYNPVSALRPVIMLFGIPNRFGKQATKTLP